jgi:fructose-bisphosphate aldolase class I
MTFISQVLLPSQTINELKTTVDALASKGKGLLAADESSNTIAKRFAALDIPCTEDTRRAYRELLLSSPGIEQYISGVILFEETLAQKTSQGIPFSELLNKQGIIPGIKVDKGLIHLSGTVDENTTQGLDGLAERLMGYKQQGARFAKWRAVYSISKETPSLLAIKTNAEILARYATICQEAGIVPIVEPEVLIDGEHDIKTCFEVSEQVLQAVFDALHLHKALLEYLILKPSMVISGKNSAEKAKAAEVAEATVSVLSRTVPAAVPSINFLSGGQTPVQATENLNAMHRLQKNLAWNVSFSYSRALQEPCLKVWAGKAENIPAAQKIFVLRAKLNSLAAVGQYDAHLESAS